jgi:hypothetical protein
MAKLEFATVFPGGVVSEKAFTGSLFPCLPIGMLCNDSKGQEYIYAYMEPHNTARYYVGTPMRLDNLFQAWTLNSQKGNKFVTLVSDVPSKNELKLPENSTQKVYVLVKTWMQEQITETSKPTGNPADTIELTKFFCFNDTPITGNVVRLAAVPARFPVITKPGATTAYAELLNDVTYYAKVDIKNGNMVTFAPYGFDTTADRNFTTAKPGVFDSGFTSFAVHIYGDGVTGLMLNTANQIRWFYFKQEAI